MKFQLHVPRPHEPEEPPQPAGVAPIVYVSEPLTWEYKLLTFDLQGLSDEEALNRLGQEGWELVTVLTQGGRAICFFKRLQ